MNEPNEVVRTSRQVIENNLLTALSEGNSVAVLFGERDLGDMIRALDLLALHSGQSDKKRLMEMAAGFRQLQRGAFPK